MGQVNETDNEAKVCVKYSSLFLFVLPLLRHEFDVHLYDVEHVREIGCEPVLRRGFRRIVQWSTEVGEVLSEQAALLYYTIRNEVVETGEENQLLFDLLVHISVLL